MVLRITRGRFDPAKYDDLVPLLQELNASAQGLPGMQSVHHTAIDRPGGRLASVSTWDTLEHAKLTREAAPALGDIIRRLLGIGVQLDPPEIYEVI